MVQKSLLLSYGMWFKSFDYNFALGKIGAGRGEYSRSKNNWTLAPTWAYYK